MIADVLINRKHKHLLTKTLWQQYLIPKSMFAHACLNFANLDLKAINVEENRAAREIIMAPLCTTTEYVKNEADIGNLERTIKTQKILLLQHISKRQGKLAEMVLVDWDHNVPWIEKVKSYMNELNININDIIHSNKLELKNKLNKLYHEIWKHNATQKGLPHYYIIHHENTAKIKRLWDNTDRKNLILHFWLSGKLKRWLLSGGMGCDCEFSIKGSDHLQLTCKRTEESRRKHEINKEDIKDLLNFPKEKRSYYLQ